MHLSFRSRKTGSGPGRRSLAGISGGALVVGMLSIVSFAQGGGSGQVPFAGYHPEKDTSVTPVNRRPDANQLMEINSKRVLTQRFTAANAERKRQLDEDAARLLKVAAELNTELEKTGAAGIPLTVSARVEMIEKLAHAVKEKMKLTMAAP